MIHTPPMNPTRIALTAGTILALTSCETHDPSAMGEIQRDLAEALAKSDRLEQEVTSLTEQLEEARSQPAPEPESLKMPAREDIEKSLAIEATKLQQAARDLHPSATVEGFSTFDLNIPSFETPFSCKAKVLLREPSGGLRTLYWTGVANMKGEWKFVKAENLEPPPPPDDQGGSREDPAKVKPNYDIPLDNPIEQPGSLTPNNPNSNITPKPAQPKKPEVKYDIPLDNPVLKPGGR